MEGVCKSVAVDVCCCNEEMMDEADAALLRGEEGAADGVYDEMD